MCLPFACLLTVACSTTVAPAPAVKVMPSAALLQRCQAATLVPAETVRDLVTNSNARQLAYDKCAARMDALAGWSEGQ